MYSLQNYNFFPGGRNHNIQFYTHVIINDVHNLILIGLKLQF